MAQVDAVVVGSGPNGLAAAITMARAGCKTILYEARSTVGGGLRSAALTEPGFVHDVCSAIHPLTLVSPFFQTVPLTDYGVEWVYPLSEVAHPLDDGTAVMTERSVGATADNLGRDGATYRAVMGWMVEHADALYRELLGPLNVPPRELFAMMGFAPLALLPAMQMGKALFREDRARAQFAGMAAHSVLSLDRIGTAAFGLMLTIAAHSAGWAFPRGGAQKIADALAAYFVALGGEIVCDHDVTSLDALPPCKVKLLDITPRHFAAMTEGKLPGLYAYLLRRYRYGAGVFKIDYALSAPIPWKAPEVARAGTVHLGGTLDEIGESERTMGLGAHARHPYVLLAQHSLFDDTRAPSGKHTAWVYCHVPGGSTVDMTARIEAQIERFAPGFREVVIARHTRNAVELEAYNPNYVGGDINSGVQDVFQQFTRPVPRLNPYSTPLEGVYLCSSATPPGGGVHGMSGYHAAASALKKFFNH
jgi:phytoene dehydrogenase-like protein